MEGKRSAAVSLGGGISEFYVTLQHFGKMWYWGIGSVLLPFAAELATLSPPWPKGIVHATVGTGMRGLAHGASRFPRNGERFVLVCANNI
jgi:hypothetical protein